MTGIKHRVEFLWQSVWPSTTRRTHRCPHCGAARLTRVARKYLAILVVRCADCGLYCTSPIFRSGDPARFYDESYRAEGSTTELPDEATLDAYRTTAFAGTDKDCHARLQILSRMAAGPRLLEVGSSWGYLLHQAERHGFQATGVEIAGGRRRFGRERLGVEIVPTLADLDDRRFDLIYSSHVLEHFTDLSDLFPQLRERLAPGGMLVVEVPNFDFERRGREVLPIIGAVHPLGFDAGFFRENLPRHGFVVRGTFPSWEAFGAGRAAEHGDDVVICHAELAPSPAEVGAS